VVVTGALGFTGKHVAGLLLERGKRVKTLTNHPGRPNPFGERLEIAPLNFADPAGLTASLTGAATLINTYWVRFPHGATTFERAVAHTRTLLKAAREAGVRRIVHVSITCASETSPLPYFRGKGVLEKDVAGSGMSYAIVRPTVIFGPGDVLINNIAWALRRFPFFPIPGRGDYRLQPVFVGDMAELTVQAALDDRNLTMDAVGPEIFTFKELVELIRARVGSRASLVHLPPAAVLSLCGLVGRSVDDVVLTRDEIEGLMAGLLVSAAPAPGTTRLSDWLRDNAATVGTAYASELGRHYRVRR